MFPDPPTGHLIGKSRVNAGIIGTGPIGAIHADDLNRDPAVSAIIATDAIPAQSEHVEATSRGTLPRCPAELSESADAVVICTPADMHAELMPRYRRAAGSDRLQSPVRSGVPPGA